MLHRVATSRLVERTMSLGHVGLGDKPFCSLSEL